MGYFTKAQLINFANNDFAEKRASVMYESASLAKVSIFLCHNHKDEQVAKGLKNFLATLNVDLYVDWMDTNMPANPNKLTAENLKKRIDTCTYFFILATDNTFESKWVPWEIGIADGIKKNEHIFIFPATTHSGNFEGVEYTQLYKNIQIAKDGKPAIFEPGATKGKYLAEIL